MSIIQDLNWRYATKEFDPTKKVSKEDVETLLDALILSASSFGLQPWKFILIENPKIKADLLPFTWNQRQVVDASHVIVLARPLVIESKDVDKYIKHTAKIRKQNIVELEGLKAVMAGFIKNMPNDLKAQWMVKQLYIALGNLLTVAAHLKIDTCPMEGFQPAEYDRVLNLKEKNLSSVLVCPIGYRSETDKYSRLPKIRYSKDELVLRY